MAQKAHVPKFRNWDGENVPYTSYFDNTRRGKGTTGKSFNPNDPQQNPDAFLSGISPPENVARKTRDSSPRDAQTTRRQQNKLYGGSDDSEFDKEYVETPPRGRERRGGSSGYFANASAEGSPEVYRASRQPGEASYHVASPVRPVLKPGKRRDAVHEMPSSVPRFGAWADANPDSGDGFTMIFNKVKQEKQMAAKKAPRAPPAAPKVHSRQKSNRAKTSAKSKISSIQQRLVVMLCGHRAPL